jgi:hypothetical protein
VKSKFNKNSNNQYIPKRQFDLPVLWSFWKRNYPLIISILLLVLARLFVPKYSGLDASDWIQIGIGVAIFWYSLETMLVRKSMIFQNELEQRPIVDLYLRPEKQTYKDVKEKEWFALRNIGRGVAYNIRVKNIEINTFKCKLFFKCANQILAPLGDERPLHMITQTKGYEKCGMIMHEVDDFLREIKYPNFVLFLVTYQNVQGKLFYSLFRLYNRIAPAEHPIIEFIRNSSGSISLEQAWADCKRRQMKLTPYHNKG